jgi:hypothetical protein
VPTIPTPSTTARLAPLAEVRELEVWRSGFQHLAKDHRYYEIVADTLGFDCRALVLEDESGRVLAIQPCFFVEQDLVVASPRAIRSIVGAVRRLFPRFLRLRLLMIGCAAGEGHLSTALTENPTWLHLLDAGLRKAARENGARMVVWKDLPAAYRTTFATWKSGTGPESLAHVPSMPATRLVLDFTSFDDYLALHLSHAMRKNLRRKFRALDAAPPLVMSVTHDLGEEADAALALYEQVRARSPLHFERLTKSFLQQLSARQPERVRYFLWHQEGRLVAFSLCLVHDGVLYDEYLGLDYRVALDLHLYFVTFRDILTWALAQGLTAYHSTPLNYEPKRHLGFELAPLDLYFALPWPALNRLALPLLKRMSPTGAEPALAEFSNADEMITMD